MGIGRLLLYLTAFGVLSLGSNLIINTISSFTRRMRIPPFLFSFFVVGFLTSIAEIAVAINAVSLKRPEIFVGSILGGTLVIFLVVIPLMTILNRGVHVKKHLSNRNRLITLGVIAMPSIFALDQVITNIEGVALVVFYLSLIYFLRSRGNTLSKVEEIFKKESRTLRENTFLRLGLGGLLIFLSSRFIVEQTLVYSDHYHVSVFLVSLVVIAIGTNLPEISLALHTASSDKAQAEDIAIGDFLGSAATNVAICGIFTLINDGDIITAKNFTSTFVFIMLALVSFYAFTRGKSILTTREGMWLMGFYVLFVGLQVAGI